MSFLLTFSNVPALTDEEAMWQVQKNDDHQAFAQLVARWEAPIFRLCTRLTGDPHQGEDLKQEARIIGSASGR